MNLSTNPKNNHRCLAVLWHWLFPFIQFTPWQFAVILVTISACTEPLLIAPSQQPLGCNIYPTYFDPTDNELVDFRPELIPGPGDSVKLSIHNTTLVAKCVKIEQHDLYTHVQLSLLDGQNGYALLTYRGPIPYSSSGIWLGEIRYTGNSYELFRCTTGQYRLARVDPTRLNDYHQDRASAAENPPVGRPSCAGEGSGFTIDVLLVYTRQAANYAGGPLAMEVRMIQAVEQCNTVFVNSGMQTRLHICQIKAIGDSLQGYPALESPDVGMKEKAEILDTLSAMKELASKASADIVLVAVQNATSANNGYSSGTVSIVKSEKMVVNYLTAHEIGHLLGGKHEHGCLKDTISSMTIMGNKEDYSRLPYFHQNDICKLDILTADYDSRASELAKNRCFLGDSTVVIQDHFNDLGTVPSHSGANDTSILNSAMVYPRNDGDWDRTHLFQAQKPDTSSNNHLFAILKNGNTRHMRGKVVFYHYSNTLTVPTEALQLVDSTEEILIPPHTSKVVSIPLDKVIAQLGNRGFLAQWKGSNMPSHSAPSATSSTLLNLVTNSKFTAARSAVNISFGTGSSVLSNQLQPTIFPKSSRLVEFELTYSVEFGEEIRIRLFPSQAPHRKTFARAGGGLGVSFYPSPDSILVLASDSINGPRPKTNALMSKTPVVPLEIPTPILKGDPKTIHTLYLSLDASAIMDDAVYPLRVEQWKNGQLMGCYTLNLSRGTFD